MSSEQVIDAAPPTPLAMLNRVWNRLLEIGADAAPVLEQKYVRISNAICALCLVGTVAQLPVFVPYLPETTALVGLCLAYLVLLCGTLFMNARGWRLAASLNLNLGSLFFMAVLSVLLGRTGNAHYIQLGIILAAFAMYPGRWKWAAGVVVVLSAGAFLFFQASVQDMGPIVSLPDSFLAVFRGSVMATLVFVVAGFSLFTQLVLRDTDRKLERATASAVRAQAESERLLTSILPPQVASELKRTGRVEPLFYDAVTVLFTDFVGFTQASQKMRPDELVQELDGCFSQFDSVAERNHLEKLKTIGDAYMCAAGLPALSNTHAINACLAALELREFMAQMARMKSALGREFWSIRIGIHSGPVTAGVIGTNKFAYDIWGDTVNTANRMESAGVPGEVNISQTTHELIRNFFVCERRGLVEAKGKGKLEMYFLRRIRPELSADRDGLVPGGPFMKMREALADPFSEASQMPS